MASNIWTPRWSMPPSADPSSRQPRTRPIPIRVRTFSEAAWRNPVSDDGWYSPRSRQKSAFDVSDLSPRQANFINDVSELSETALEITQTSSHDTTVLTPPTSPISRTSHSRESSDTISGPDLIKFDFTKIDYELERAKELGQGLWSTVYLAEHKTSSPNAPALLPPSPPTTPERGSNSAAASLYAVKIATRSDSLPVFEHEARVLSRLQRHPCSSQYLVPFRGQDDRNGALVFDAVIGGSLENLIGRLKQMTEVSRHLELINIFPGIAYDLTSGLSFLHSAGLVHADIKPANILLDISTQTTHPTIPVIRTRYIDFSASFFPPTSDPDPTIPVDPLSLPPPGGGTWDFMAPEQLHSSKLLSTPTPASDIWSLGITLLTILTGSSPYAALSSYPHTTTPPSNPAAIFRLRDAVKSGDPLGWARGGGCGDAGEVRKRLAAVQEFVDCVRLALVKEREKRVGAAGWVEWIEERQIGG